VECKGTLLVHLRSAFAHKAEVRMLGSGTHSLKSRSASARSASVVGVTVSGIIWWLLQGLRSKAAGTFTSTTYVRGTVGKLIKHRRLSCTVAMICPPLQSLPSPTDPRLSGPGSRPCPCHTIQNRRYCLRNISLDEDNLIRPRTQSESGAHPIISTAIATDRRIGV